MPIGIFTALECEYLAVRLLLSQNGQVELDRYGDVVGQIQGASGNHQVILPPYRYGQSATSAIAAALLERYSDTAYLIFIGCAGGVPPAQIGDLLISKAVVDLDHAKLHRDGRIEQRGDLKPPSGLILDTARTLLADIHSGAFLWKDYVGKFLESNDSSKSKKWRELLERRVPVADVGVIGTSMKNVNDPLVRTNWAQSDYKIGCFETEGGGIATTANVYDKGFILIRGISDLADGNRDDDILQPYAARVATAFLAALLARVRIETTESTKITIGVPDRQRELKVGEKGEEPSNISSLRVHKFIQDCFTLFKQTIEVCTAHGLKPRLRLKLLRYDVRNNMLVTYVQDEEYGDRYFEIEVESGLKKGVIICESLRKGGLVSRDLPQDHYTHYLDTMIPKDLAFVMAFPIKNIKGKDIAVVSLDSNMHFKAIAIRKDGLEGIFLKLCDVIQSIIQIERLEDL